MSKVVGFRINKAQERIWEDFKKFVKEQKGKKHTALGEEVINAISLYLKANRLRINFEDLINLLTILTPNIKKTTIKRGEIKITGCRVQEGNDEFIRIEIRGQNV